MGLAFPFGEYILHSAVKTHCPNVRLGILSQLGNNRTTMLQSLEVRVVRVQVVQEFKGSSGSKVQVERRELKDEGRKTKDDEDWRGMRDEGRWTRDNHPEKRMAQGPWFKDCQKLWAHFYTPDVEPCRGVAERNRMTMQEKRLLLRFEYNLSSISDYRRHPCQNQVSTCSST